jgi:CDP-diacylglycerol--glycerol-3-phosphate 3-phosphatidyltransferase
MVLVALTILVHLYDMGWQIVIPAALIILREVLVSGLREFLGDVKLQVTRLAKWKTTLQMFAICLLLTRGALLPPQAGKPLPPFILKALDMAAIAVGSIGLLLLWIAAWFTLVTGWDYLRKGMPYIREKERTGTRPATDAET